MKLKEDKSASRIAASRIAASRIAASRIAASRIAASRIAASGTSGPPETAVPKTLAPKASAPETSALSWLSLASLQFNPSQLTRILEVIEHPLELFPDGHINTSCPHLLKMLGHLRAQSRGQSMTAAERLARAVTLLEKAERWSESPHHHLLTLDSADYPPLLQQIDDPPAVLFVSGQPAVLRQPQLAIVGSRRATPAALNIGHQWAGELARSGLVITSGLARGMDRAAHTGCLQAGGRTVAVMASGPDLCYPNEHKSLLAEIQHTGAVVTEFFPGLSPLPRHFPQRNRIISGLSSGTLVVEARQKSGTLVTARHAMEQNREVFAVPGSINNPESRGCHQLIQQGAKLVQKTGDILEELTFEQQKSLDFTETVETRSTLAAYPEEQQEQLQKLLDAAGYDPVNIDSLCHATGLPVQSLMPLVLILELQSRLKSLGDGRYVRC